MANETKGDVDLGPVFENIAKFSQEMANQMSVHSADTIDYRTLTVQQMVTELARWSAERAFKYAQAVSREDWVIVQKLSVHAANFYGMIHHLAGIEMAKSGQSARLAPAPAPSLDIDDPDIDWGQSGLPHPDDREPAPAPAPVAPTNLDANKSGPKV
jgi:hypothetical protein